MCDGPPSGDLLRLEEMVFINLGFVSPDDLGNQRFKIVNKTGEDFVVVKVEPDCSCTTVGKFESNFAAGAMLELGISLPKTNFAGPALTKVQIFLERMTYPVTVILKSEITSEVSLNRKTVDFGELETVQNLEIAGEPGVVITSVVSASSLLNLNEVGKEVNHWRFVISPLIASEFGTEIIRVQYNFKGRSEVRDLPMEVMDSSAFRFIPRRLFVEIVDRRFSGKVRIISRSEVVDEMIDLKFDFAGFLGTTDQIDVVSSSGRIRVVEFQGHFESEIPERFELVLVKADAEVSRLPVYIVSKN
jgi:hypothetical protein